MKVENLILLEPPTFEVIRSYFERTDETKRTFCYGPEVVKANRKIVIQHNQLKSNYLHIYIRNRRLNVWVHYVENSNGDFKCKDYAGPEY